MTRVHKVDDPHVALAHVLTVQTPGVLLQCALPGNGHGEHQSIERRMVEAFADQLAGRQQHAGLVGRQPRCMSLLWFQRNPLPTEWTAQRDLIAAFDA